jgi:hypothetical protein
LEKKKILEKKIENFEKIMANMPFSAKYAISGPGPIRSNMPFPAKSGVDNF